jgi:hypothetical protein
MTGIGAQDIADICGVITASGLAIEERYPLKKRNTVCLFFIFLFSFGLNVSHGNTIAPYVY